MKSELAAEVRSAAYPVRTWVLVMLSIFAVEGLIMLVLPRVMPERSVWADGLIDSTTLALVIAPVVWWLLVKPLKQVYEDRGRLLRSLYSSQEVERSGIARDLHDEVGQHLTALMVGLRSIEDANDLPQAQERARDLRQFGQVAHQEVRRIARGLRPAALDEMGILPVIDRLREDFEHSAKIPLLLFVEGFDDARLPREIETTLYRILQEALTNITRHAQASSAEVRLRRGEGFVRLIVTDDGVGSRSPALSSGRPDSLGLVGMRERAASLGGSLRFRSTRTGSAVEVNIPLEAPTHE